MLIMKHCLWSVPEGYMGGPWEKYHPDLSRWSKDYWAARPRGDMNHKDENSRE